MSSSLDLTLMPLAREAGKDQTTFPGLYLSEPPRRPARGRGSDHLILYLALTGNAPLSPGKLEQILARLAQTYYKTSGSVTAALRTVAETLNQFLLDRNLRNASSGRQAVGLLTLLTLRDSQFYLSQSGPVHAFLVNAEQTQHLYDPQISGRGLGLSRNTQIRYFQADLQPGDALLLATQPSPTWSKGTLNGIHGQGLDSLRRRLFNRADIDLNSVLIQVRQGAGEFHLVPSIPPAQAATAISETSEDQLEEVVPPVAPVIKPEQEAGPPVSEAATPEVALPAEAPPAEETAAASSSPTEVPQQDSSQAVQEAVAEAADSPKSAPAQSPDLRTAPPPVKVQPTKEQGPQTTKLDAERSSTARSGLTLDPLLGFFAAIGSYMTRAWNWFIQAVKMLVRRLLPGESLFTIPSTTMALIAVAVPLVVVSVASVVYIQRGRAGQYEILFSQAQIAAQQAGGQSDLADQRLVWETTLKLLDQAESYRITDESEALRAQAQSSLDALDLVKRPNYQSAIIGGLGNTVKVTRMVLSGDDLYMLDGNSGSVLRGRVTNKQDYEIDRSFQCGPGIYDRHVVGNLIDIVPAPVGKEPDAVVLGMDASGSVLYCFIDKEPKAEMLASPVTAPNWGNLVGFTLDVDQSNVYVLDPQDQAVWAYWGSDFVDGPEFYFGDEVPNIQDVIDLTVDKRDLYLLHVDGRMTLCTYSGLDVSPTRCADPIRYVDSRPGKVDQALVPDNPFSQVLATQPPDPSLYLLKPKSQAIYHFSLRTLNFHSQFVPKNGLASGPATAFTVDQIERVLYLAVGNQVFYANIP